MGTFHQNKGELHGITVVVETEGGELYVGRCDEVTPRGVLLLDGDVHRPEDAEKTREEYLAQAAKFGVWKSFDRLLVPEGQVTAIRRLGDVAGP